MNFLYFLFNIFNIFNLIYSQPCTFNSSQVTNYINNYRALHQAPNVTYDKNIASASQAWADYMATNNVFKHSNSLYGENLALFSFGQIPDCTNRTTKAIDLWYAEGANYTYSDNTFNNLYGHFTQTVWVSSKYIGAGVAYGNKKIYVVMNFNPPGNYAGAFTKNVLPINKPPGPILSPPVPILSPPVPILSPPVPIILPPHPVISLSPPVPILPPPVPIILPPHPVISSPPVIIAKSPKPPKPPKYLPPPPSPPETPKSSAKFLSPEKVIISILCILSIIY